MWSEEMGSPIHQDFPGHKQSVPFPGIPPRTTQTCYSLLLPASEVSGTEDGPRNRSLSLKQQGSPLKG